MTSGDWWDAESMSSTLKAAEKEGAVQSSKIRELFGWKNKNSIASPFGVRSSSRQLSSLFLCHVLTLWSLFWTRFFMSCPWKEPSWTLSSPNTSDPWSGTSENVCHNLVQVRCLPSAAEAGSLSKIPRKVSWFWSSTSWFKSFYIRKDSLNTPFQPTESWTSSSVPFTFLQPNERKFGSVTN